MDAYFPPPNGYHQVERCQQCGGLVTFGPVIGGHKWSHLIGTDHEVVIRPSGWWDVSIGAVRYGAWGKRDPVIPEIGLVADNG